MTAEMSPEERAAWLDGLSPDDRTIVYAPVGWRYSLVSVALVKRQVEALGLSISDRLKILQELGKMSGGSVTAEAVAHVQPACATAEDMAKAANYNLDVFGEVDVFREFVRLNPSLLEALRLCGSFPQSNIRDDLPSNSI